MAKLLPYGIALAAAGVLFAISPEARKAARKLAVKGAGALLEITDQIKEASSLLQTKSTENDKPTEHWLG
ncbi:hypothetical protein ACFQ88_34750 [Paenibacillus sp. NPDC056579]|uniref:hypothetical protein n=1 Tax=Paenibacillus sp. NPDC056579 TaxID=3345871 RepID=UPI00368A4FA3